MTTALIAPLRAQAFVMGKLNFVERGGRPVASYVDAATGALSGAEFRLHRVPISDARQGTILLDVQGFQLLRAPSAIADYSDEQELERVGRAEAAALVKSITGAESVLVFDHTVRKHDPHSTRQPSLRIHNDYTAVSAAQRVRDFMGEGAEARLKRRFAFINVWRPIRHAALDRPLALCDARSVAADDLVVQELIYADRRGENYALAYNPAQRWHYFPRMQLDEAVLIKCYDSRANVASITPHTSFDDPNAPANAPPRESVEYRAIAFY